MLGVLSTLTYRDVFAERSPERMEMSSIPMCYPHLLSTGSMSVSQAVFVTLETEKVDKISTAL